MIKIELTKCQEEWLYGYDGVMCDHCEKIINKNLEYIEILGDDGGLNLHKKCFKSFTKEISEFMNEIKTKSLIKKLAGI
jgi:hypothetical protein